MVKIIPTQKRELLTNLEVYKLVATHQEAEKAKSKGRKKANRADEGLNTVTLETLNYLKKTSAPKQNLEMISEFAARIKSDPSQQDEKKKLTNAEIVQFINLRPTQAVEVSLIVEDIEERIDEESVDRIAEITSELLPEP